MEGEVWGLRRGREMTIRERMKKVAAAGEKIQTAKMVREDYGV